MDTLIKADIFFFVATIGVILFILILVVAGLYVLGILRDFKKISKILRGGTERVSGHLDDLAKNVEESDIFKFFFGSKKKKRKTKED